MHRYFKKYFLILKYITLCLLILVAAGCGNNTHESSMSNFKRCLFRKYLNYKYSKLVQYQNIDKVVNGYIKNLKGDRIPKCIIEQIKKYVVDNELLLKALIVDSDLYWTDHLTLNLLQNINFSKIYHKDIFAKSIFYPRSETFKYLTNVCKLSMNSTYLESLTYETYKLKEIEKTLLKKYTMPVDLINFIKSKNILSQFDVNKFNINQYFSGKTLLHLAAIDCNSLIYLILRNKNANPLYNTKKNNHSILDLVFNSNKDSESIKGFLTAVGNLEPNKQIKKSLGENGLISLLNSEFNDNIELIHILITDFKANLFKKHKDNKTIWYHILSNAKIDIEFFNKLIKLSIEQYNYPVNQDLESVLLNNNFNNIKNDSSLNKLEVKKYLDKMIIRQNNKKNIKNIIEKKIIYTVVGCLILFFFSKILRLSLILFR